MINRLKNEEGNVLAIAIGIIALISFCALAITALSVQISMKTSIEMKAASNENIAMNFIDAAVEESRIYLNTKESNWSIFNQKASTLESDYVGLQIVDVSDNPTYGLSTSNTNTMVCLYGYLLDNQSYVYKLVYFSKQELGSSTSMGSFDFSIASDTNLVFNGRASVTGNIFGRYTYISDNLYFDSLYDNSYENYTLMDSEYNSLVDFNISEAIYNDTKVYVDDLYQCSDGSINCYSTTTSDESGDAVVEIFMNEFEKVDIVDSTTPIGLCMDYSDWYYTIGFRDWFEEKHNIDLDDYIFDDYLASPDTDFEYMAVLSEEGESEFWDTIFDPFYDSLVALFTTEGGGGWLAKIWAVIDALGHMVNERSYLTQYLDEVVEVNPDIDAVWEEAYGDTCEEWNSYSIGNSSLVKTEQITTFYDDFNLDDYILEFILLEGPTSSNTSSVPLNQSYLGLDNVIDIMDAQGDIGDEADDAYVSTTNLGNSISKSTIYDGNLTITESFMVSNIDDALIVNGDLTLDYTSKDSNDIEGVFVVLGDLILQGSTDIDLAATFYVSGQTIFNFDPYTGIHSGNDYTINITPEGNFNYENHQNEKLTAIYSRDNIIIDKHYTDYTSDTLDRDLLFLNLYSEASIYINGIDSTFEMEGLVSARGNTVIGTDSTGSLVYASEYKYINSETGQQELLSGIVIDAMFDSYLAVSGSTTIPQQYDEYGLNSFDLERVKISAFRDPNFINDFIHIPDNVQDNELILGAGAISMEKGNFKNCTVQEWALLIS